MPRNKSILSAAQKAAHTRKWRRASEKAHKSGQQAKTFTKYLLSKKGYKCLDLDSRMGYEYKGIVDLLAVKRHRHDPDVLHVILFQVKGGSARVSNEEIARLAKATRQLKVSWNVAEKPMKSVSFKKAVR